MKRTRENCAGETGKSLLALAVIALALVCLAAPARANTIAGGTLHSLGVKADGTVVAWGYNEWGVCNVPDGLSGVVAVAAGHNTAWP